MFVAGTTGLEPAASAVTGHLDLESQALTRSAKERKILKDHRREFLLFPDSFDPKRRNPKAADELAPTQ
jgi:hypothetical protein